MSQTLVSGRGLTITRQQFRKQINFPATYTPLLHSVQAVGAVTKWGRSFSEFSSICPPLYL